MMPEGDALTDGLGARLELAEHLAGALVSGGYNSGWCRIKRRAEMLVGFWHAMLFQQQLRKVRHSHQFKQAGGPTSRPVDRRQQASFGFNIILGRSGRQDEPFHPEQGRHVEKFSATMLRINCVYRQRQRLLVLTHGSKTRTHVADKVHIERVVTLSVKLFQSPLQQRNPSTNIILKDQPPTSQASRNGAVGLILQNDIRGGVPLLKRALEELHAQR